MEVAQSDAHVRGTGRRVLWTAVAIVAIMAFALFLRTYWNIDAATGDGFIFFGGSDAYYEKRAIDHILDNDFQSLVRDPLLNYPYGAVNPNPPFYDWLTAVTAYLAAPVAFGGDVDAAAWWVTLWAPAIWGTLTILPIYFIAATLFGRREGVVAAFFWALSTSAIDTTSFGDSRHYAPFMFFIALTMAFYVKAVKGLRGETNWVTRWSDGGAVARGLGAFLRARKRELGFAALAGVSLAGVGLIWKGFPYVLAIIGLYAVIQMVVDHWRNRDPLSVFVGTLIVFAISLALMYPYYYGPVQLGSFVRPAWYMLAGFLFVGLVLTPTRDLPTVLVMPLVALAGILSAVVAFFVAPTIAQSLLYSAVYFKKTALYQTIAEAHPASFNEMVFSVGPWAFFLGLAGVVYLAWRMRKEYQPVYLFVVVWSVIAIYMAHTAARFLINAVPVFAVLGAWMTVKVWDWIDFGAFRRGAEATQSAWQGFKRGFSPVRHISGIFLVVFVLIAPTLFIAVDAAVPFEYEQERMRHALIDDLVASGRGDRATLADLSFSEVADEWQTQSGAEVEPPFMFKFFGRRLGAFGQADTYAPWHEGLKWLDAHDAGVPPADRPGVVSWWDYGHIEIAISNHPAVADNFQNGYEYAARVLLAQNETQAVQLFGARHLNFASVDGLAALAEAGVPEADRATALGQLKKFEFAPALDLAESVAFTLAVEKQSGKRIRYFAVDERMLPSDNETTPSIDEPSIFYAPVVLAKEDIKDYVETRYIVGARPTQPGEQLRGTTELSEAEYEARQRDAFATPIQASQIFYTFKQPFFNSMFWRAYIGAEVFAGTGVQGDEVAEAVNRFAPASGLTHFRLVYAGPGLRIVEFTPGATVTGTLLRADGMPIANTEIAAADDAGGTVLTGIVRESARSRFKPEDFNIIHATTTTNAEGKFTIIVPFGNVTLLAGEPGAELARTYVQVSRAQAEARTAFTATLTVQPARVEGIVFVDDDNDNVVDANETVVANATVDVAGVRATTDATGRYAIDNLTPGVQDVNVTGVPYEVIEFSKTVGLRAGELAFHNVSLTAKKATVTGLVFADKDADATSDDGEAAASVSLLFTPASGGSAVPTSTSETGVYSVKLAPGDYTVTATTTLEDGNTYSVDTTFTVAEGADTVSRDFALSPN